MNKKRTGLIVLIVIALFALLSSISSVIGGKGARKTKGPFGSLLANFSKDEYIAELHIEGEIDEANRNYNQKWLLSTIDDLKNDDMNVGIALFINSPGGSVYQADEAYLTLMDYKKTTRRPVYVYQESLAASGGYYISCAGDKIFANRNTLTGSIGVITGTSIDCTELLDKIGVKAKTIHAGKNKNMFNFNEPLTEEQKKIMQDIADECYDQFTEIVSENREGLSLDDVKKLADGRVYTAKQAKANKLIDDIASKEEFYDAFKKEKLDSQDYAIEEFKYEYSPNFGEFIFDSITGSSSAKTFEDILPVSKVKYPAYLYTGF